MKHFINILYKALSIVIFTLCSISTYAQLVDRGQENILKYKQYRPVYETPWAKDSLRPLYASISVGTEGLLHNNSIKWGESLNMNIRLGLGYWINSVSGIEASGIYNSDLAGLLIQDFDKRSEIDKNTPDWGLELNYLFNFTNFSSKSLTRPKFRAIGGIGINYRFDGKSNISSYGSQTFIRLDYAPSKNISFYLEPKVSFGKNNFESTLSNYGYYIQPSIHLGMNVSIYNFNDTEKKAENTIKKTKNGTNSLQPESQLLKIKTNILYDILLLPNLSLEVPIMDRWSVGVELMSSWWLNKANTQCMQTEYLGLQGRYYWSRFSNERANTGWYAGIFGGFGRYDLQLHKSKGVQSDKLYTVSASIGYSWAISKCMNLEFEAGAGFLQTDYIKYVIRADKLIQDGNRMRYTAFIPTKAGINIVWIISMKKKVKEGVL